jgi:hypothetical protein
MRRLAPEQPGVAAAQARGGLSGTDAVRVATRGVGWTGSKLGGAETWGKASKPPTATTWQQDAQSEQEWLDLAWSPTLAWVVGLAFEASAAACPCAAWS